MHIKLQIQNDKKKINQLEERSRDTKANDS